MKPCSPFPGHGSGPWSGIFLVPCFSRACPTTDTMWRWAPNSLLKMGGLWRRPSSRMANNRENPKMDGNTYTSKIYKAAGGNGSHGTLDKVAPHHRAPDSTRCCHSVRVMCTTLKGDEDHTPGRDPRTSEQAGNVQIHACKSISIDINTYRNNKVLE